MAQYQSILDTIGKTPLIGLPKLSKGLGATLLFKLEFFNPLSSVKDRIAYSMITDAEAKGVLKPGTRVIEPTSGNTGLGLAFVCAAKGYPITLVMPETMSMERRQLLLLLGAEVILTPGPLGMKGAIAKANEIYNSTPGSFMPRQFDNPANPEIHYRTTGPEIWEDTQGKVDIVVSGIGTGGTFTGVGRYLRERKPGVKMVAIEPVESAVIAGGKPGPHKIQGIGGGFVPKNFDRSYLDHVETVSSEDAIAMARRVIREEGVPIGISSGAAVAVALRLGAKPEYAGKTIVTVLASSAERYLSSVLGEEARQKASSLVTQPVSDELLKSMNF